MVRTKPDIGVRQTRMLGLVQKWGKYELSGRQAWLLCVNRTASLTSRSARSLNSSTSSLALPLSYQLIGDLLFPEVKAPPNHEKRAADAYKRVESEFGRGTPQKGAKINLSSPAVPGAASFVFGRGHDRDFQTFGGLPLQIGPFTRPFAFILSGEMAVAYFKFHAPAGILAAAEPWGRRRALLRHVPISRQRGWRTRGALIACSRCIKPLADFCDCACRRRARSTRGGIKLPTKSTELPVAASAE